MDQPPRPPKSFPAIIFSEATLYQEFDVTGDALWKALDVIYFQGNYDAYCPACRQTSTFRVAGHARPSHHERKPLLVGSVRINRGGVVPIVHPPVGSHLLTAKCSRADIHVQHFAVLLTCRSVAIKAEGSTDGNVEFKSKWFLQKIGQHPSRADLDLPAFKKYRRVLENAQQRELATAVGLNAHGVGIGSFVYLRRTFESLVEQARVAASSEANWNENAYREARMNDRVQMLAHQLPEFMVKNSGVYAILSKGIHELADEECLRYFDVVRIAIEAILDERLAQVNRLDRAKAAAAAIADFSRQ